MNSNPYVIDATPLSVMRRILAEASSRLGIQEGSRQHEELASRILALFEGTNDADEVLAAALEHRRPATEERRKPV